MGAGEAGRGFLEPSSSVCARPLVGTLHLSTCRGLTLASLNRPWTLHFTETGTDLTRSHENPGECWCVKPAHQRPLLPSLFLTPHPLPPFVVRLCCDEGVACRRGLSEWVSCSRQLCLRSCLLCGAVLMTSRLLPCPGYYKQCCGEHWGTRVSFPSGFLSVYAQQWDCWIIRHVYLQFFKESPHCSP